MTDSTAIRFFCPGLAKTAGSKRPITPKGWTRTILIDDCKKGADWKADLKAFALAAYSGPPLEGPLELTCCFTMQRPKGHSGKNGLKTNAPTWHISKPDVLKLTRCLEDALTGILWRDDSQIAGGDALEGVRRDPGR